MLKNANINGVWVTVELTEEEKEKILDELLNKNIHELIRCVEKAETAFVSCKGYIDRTEIIKMLYKKQSIASYSALAQALDKKIHKLRTGVSHKSAHENLSKEEQEKIKKSVENGLKKHETEKSPSVFDEYLGA